MQTILEKGIIPIIVGSITFLLFRKIDEWKKRKSISKLGVAVIDTLIEEVENGVQIMNDMLDPKNLNKSLLPKNSWDKMNTISDDILLRIIEVSKNEKPESFSPSQIRIHCKNYFTHMNENYTAIFADTTAWKDKGVNLVNNSRYLEAANKVLIMLKQTRQLLEDNSKNLFPK